MPQTSALRLLLIERTRFKPTTSHTIDTQYWKHKIGYKDISPFYFPKGKIGNKAISPLYVPKLEENINRRKSLHSQTRISYAIFTQETSEEQIFHIIPAATTKLEANLKMKLPTGYSLAQASQSSSFIMLQIIIKSWELSTS